MPGASPCSPSSVRVPRCCTGTATPSISHARRSCSPRPGSMRTRPSPGAGMRLRSSSTWRPRCGGSSAGTWATRSKLRPRAASIWAGSGARHAVSARGLRSAGRACSRPGSTASASNRRPWQPMSATTSSRSSFAALYQRTAPQLFGIALRILRQREEAEDVLQEAFTAVWDRAASFDPARGSAMTWLVTVLRHRAIDRRRRRAHLEDRLGSDEDLLALSAAATDEADRGAGLAALQKCLGELEAQPRRAVLLAYAYGYTHEELAKRLATPIGTVKSWVRRSLERLKRCLDG